MSLAMARSIHDLGCAAAAVLWAPISYAEAKEEFAESVRTGHDIAMLVLRCPRVFSCRARRFGCGGGWTRCPSAR